MTSPEIVEFIAYGFLIPFEIVFVIDHLIKRSLVVPKRGLTVARICEIRDEMTSKDIKADYIIFRPGTKFVAPSDCSCGDIRVAPFGDKLLVACPCKNPRYLDADGNYDYDIT